MSILTERRDALYPYLHFSRDEWAALRAATPLPLTAEELATLSGLNEPIALTEVSDIYLPLSRPRSILMESAVREPHWGRRRGARRSSGADGPSLTSRHVAVARDLT